MTYTLVIVESPAKCLKIENFLGPGYKCVASFGHITEMKGIESLNINESFIPTYTLIETKKKHISKLRYAIKNAQDIVLASDDDREGEAIAWHICQQFGLCVGTTKRIIFNEITATAIKKAIKTPVCINMGVVNAQQTRQILDMLVGFQISPILWKKISNSKLSAGRCQTPALRLVYDNYKEIQSSVGEKVYQTTGYFTHHNLPFKLDHNESNEKGIEDFLHSTIGFQHIYSISNPSEVISKPPLPLTTSILQQKASNELKFSPKQTMQLCQRLYEEGHITYMRTDTIGYSEEFIHEIKSFINNSFGNEYCNNKIVFNSMQGAQEAHESIRPTKIDCESVEMGNKDNKLYQLIRRNTIESCMPPAVFSSITASIEAPKKHVYKYVADKIVFLGWKVVAGYNDNVAYTSLLRIKQNSAIKYKNIISNVYIKNTKSHYTEARLVQLLEKQGIGRPSTFSSLIDKIQERGYVKKQNVVGEKIKCNEFELSDAKILKTKITKEFGNERGKLVLQPVGLVVIEFLIDNFNKLFEYKFTENMEKKLDNIAHGTESMKNVCEVCNDEILRLIKSTHHLYKDSIVIDEAHSYIIGKYGPVIKSNIDGKITFKKVKDDIDINKLKRGEYSIDDIVIANNVIGKYQDKDIVIKKGKYGYFAIWDNNTVSIPSEQTEMADIIALFKNRNTSTIIRTISEDVSIRKGKYGDYIYYKTKQMKKPRFLKLEEFIAANGKGSYKTCEKSILAEWLSDMYDI